MLFLQASSGWCCVSAFLDRWCVLGPQHFFQEIDLAVCNLTGATRPGDLSKLGMHRRSQNFLLLLHVRLLALFAMRLVTLELSGGLLVRPVSNGYLLLLVVLTLQIYV